MGKYCKSIYWLNLSIFTYIILFVISCASIGPPTAEERTLIRAGDSSVVLIRVICEFEDGHTVEPFHSSNWQDNVNVRVYNSDQEAEKSFIQRFLSTNTQKQGWIYFVLTPGTHYFAFTGPMHTGYQIEESEYARRWQMDIKKNTLINYGGTMKLYCRPRLLSTFCDTHDERRMVVLDETNLANKVVLENIADYGTIATNLMSPYD